ncbi:MAG: SPFH domain-containing protein [Synergistaceae bacterium]|nr:SPFH domain-containing protein [Synergistaceae bacterium]
MAVIQIVQWDDKLNSNDVLAWRYIDRKNPAKSDELGNWTQLIVRENQEAILFRDGQALDLFRAGRHSLSMDNIPMLRRLLNIPTGGESAFKAGVWFVNKVNVLDIKWGTPTPILLKDPEYQIPIYVRAFGQFGLRVSESRQFVLKLAGNKTELTRSDIESYFKGLILSKMGDMISTYIAHKKINVFEINAYLEDMSNEAVDKIRAEFMNFGIEPLNFYFGSVNVLDDDEGIKKLKSAMSERASMNVIGYNYQQQRSFDVLEAAAKNEGGSSLLGAGVGLGAGMGMAGPIGQMAAQMNQYINPTATPPAPPAAPAPTPTTPTPTSSLLPPTSSTCPSCGQPVSEGSKFCPNCGARLVCPNCGNALIPGAKFCPNCGNKI